MSYGNRPPTSGSNYGGTMGYRPPSAGAGFGAPGTASRGRQTSSWSNQQPTAGMGVALNTGVEVAPRPVMKEGMKGMQGMQGATQGAAGPRRQVLDRSYHLGQLRAKIAELVAELSRLKEDEQKCQRNAGSISAFTQKLKKLEQEVGEAKGKYSDLNYAVEKSAGGVDIDKINREASELRDQNKQSKEAGIFKLMERKKCDEKLRLVQQETEKPLVELEERIQKEPAKRKDYHDLREHSAKLAGELHVREKDLVELGKRYEALQNDVKADPMKQQQFVTQEDRKSVV